VCVCVCMGCFYQPSIGDGEQENIPIEEVFEQLRCTKEGLTTDEGNNRLAIFGSNKLEEKVVQSTNSSFLCHFIFCFFSRGISGHPEEASSRWSKMSRFLLSNFTIALHNF
jgi:hypothetical protein